MMGLRVALRSTSRIRLDAEFDCAAGELVALVGPSGSGKTSILRAIAGLWRLPGLSGHIRVQGRVWFDSTQDINLAPQARRAGLVFQHYALFPHMSATANVALAADKHWTAQDIAASFGVLSSWTRRRRRRRRRRRWWCGVGGCGSGGNDGVIVRR